MGLDMYLYRKTYIGTCGERRPKIELDDLPHIDATKICEVREEAGYWRKANHIHKWFVDNVQDGVDDCGDYYVSEAKLKELRDACAAVLADPCRASELLPTQSGFFFGSTAYGEWYIEDTKHTVDIIDSILADSEKIASIPRDGCYISVWYEYHSSW